MPPLPESLPTSEERALFDLRLKAEDLLLDQFTKNTGKRPKIADHTQIKAQVAAMNVAELQALLQSQAVEVAAPVTGAEVAENQEKLSAKEDLKRELARCREEITTAHLPEYSTRRICLFQRRRSSPEPGP